MKTTVIHFRDLKEKDYGRTRVTDILNSKGYPKVSIARVKRIGVAPTGFSPISDVINYVLDGKGKITVGNRVCVVGKGDLVFIPKKTRYNTSKGLTLLVVSAPRFQRDKHTYPKS